MKIRAIILILIATLGICHGEQKIEFIDRTGTFPIKGTDTKVAVIENDGDIRWTIGGSTMTNPKIDKDANWFIAVAGNESFWIYFGSGKLFHLYWSSEKNIHMNDCSDLNIDKHQIPPEVASRIKKDPQQAASSNP